MLRGVLLDLDGTLYHGEAQVPGAAGFVRRLRELGVACLFVTNRANRTPEEVAEQISGFGIPCGPGDVLTSAQATARFLKSGAAYCIGERGIELALEEVGIRLTDQAPDYVVVSYDRGFNYTKLATACRLIGEGARFVATNPDSALKTRDGLLPGTGAIVAAVEGGTGRKPVMVGKPNALIFEMALAQMDLPADQVLAVGDNVLTDIPAGFRAGMRTVLLLTGVSTRADALAAFPQPTWIVEDYKGLLELVEREVAAGSGADRKPGSGGDGVGALSAAAVEWVGRLRLAPHPEGGYYREVYRSSEVVRRAGLPARFGGDRSLCTSIDFLLPAGRYSALHRIAGDEVWHFHAGDDLWLHTIDPAGELRSVVLGVGGGARVSQAVVPAGSWMAAETGGQQGYALVGCTVAPGFDFADFELGQAEGLAREFPAHATLIRRLAGGRA